MNEIFEILLTYHALYCNPVENSNSWQGHCNIIAWLINKKEIGWFNTPHHREAILSLYAKECESEDVKYFI